MFWWTLLSLNLDIPIAANGGAIEEEKTKKKKKKRNCIVDSDEACATRVLLVTQKRETWSLFDYDVP